MVTGIPHPPDATMVTGIPHPPDATMVTGIPHPPGATMVTGIPHPPDATMVTGIPPMSPTSPGDPTAPRPVMPAPGYGGTYDATYGAPPGAYVGSYGSAPPPSSSGVPPPPGYGGAPGYGDAPPPGYGGAGSGAPAYGVNTMAAPPAGDSNNAGTPAASEDPTPTAGSIGDGGGGGGEECAQLVALEAGMRSASSPAELVAVMSSFTTSLSSFASRLPADTLARVRASGQDVRATRHEVWTPEVARAYCDLLSRLREVRPLG